ncbi:MAG: hypothetical protein KDE27_11155 [Planctomycetes bacterium]|nr:hypothetical protein [Planctomycetota bacterium]
MALLLSQGRSASIALAGLFALQFAAAARGQCTTSWLPGDPVAGIDGTVFALTMHDPDGAGPLPAVLLAGGTFSAAGSTPAVGLAAYDLATGTWSGFAGGIGENERISTLLSLPNGDLIAGGAFTSIGGIPARNIARWNGATWSQLGAGNTIGEILALALRPNGDIVAGGTFEVISGTTARHVASWDGTSWQPMGLGFSGNSVHSLAVLPNGNVVAGGRFFHNGAALNLAERIGSTWVPLTSTVGTSTDTVHALTVLPNGDLIAGGSFTVIGAVSAPHVARWNGGAWSALGGGLDGDVWALAPAPGGGLYAVGGFVASGTTPMRRAALWNGSSWSALGGGIGTSYARAAAVAPNGDVFAGGYFEEASGLALRSIARFDGALWQPMPFGTQGRITTVLARGGELVVAGEFGAVAGFSSGNIAHFDGTTWSTLGGGTDGAVHDAAWLGTGDLVIAGDFTTVGGIAATGLARWDGVAWHAVAGFPVTVGQSVEALADGSVLLAGQSGQATALARWDGTTFTFLPGLFGWVRDLTELPNGDLVAVGTLATTSFAAGVARFDGTSWSAIGHALGNVADDVASATALPGGDLIVGGSFFSIYGVLAANIARWDGTTWQALGSGLSGPPWALATLANGELVAAGTFYVAPNARNLARWDGATWSSIGGGVNGQAAALALAPDGTLIVGGEFSIAGGQVATNLARWQPSCPASVTQLSPPCANAAGPLALTVSTPPWTGGAYAAECRGLSTPALAAVLIGLSSPNTPLAALHPTGVPNCNLLASPDAALFLAPGNGVATFRLDVGGDPAFAGLPLFTQVLQLALTAQGNPLQLSASNALRAVIGTY